MTDPMLVLPSPFLGPAAYVGFAQALTRLGHPATVASLPGVPRSGHDVVTAWRAVLEHSGPVTLVAHSNAGLHAAALSSEPSVRGVVYVDAALPRLGAGRVWMTRRRMRPWLGTKAASDGTLPVWTDWWRADAIDSVLPRGEVGAVIVAGQPQLSTAYLASSIRVPYDWADRPSAYLGFGETYAAELARARRARWPLRVIDGNHLALAHDPEHVARAVIDLVGAVDVEAV